MAVNFVLKTSSGSTVITSDPDHTTRKLYHQAGVMKCLSGRRVRDIFGIHYDFELRWDEMAAAQYEALRELYYSGVKLYLDDGNVSPLIETGEYLTGTIYNYVGITNPSSTHIAYKKATATLPTAKDDYETAEFTTVEYEKVDVDDANCAFVIPSAGYGFHKFIFESGVVRANVERLRVKVVVKGTDSSPSSMDGVILMAWNGAQWIELTRVETNAKTDLEYETTDSETAKSFVDSGDDYIRFFARTRGNVELGGGIVLYSYYAEVEINGTSSYIFTLTHTPILSSGDVIWVKNLTTVQTLVLDTDYTISGREITITGQSVGDEIEIKYSAHHEVKFDNIPEKWLSGDPDSARHRDVAVNLNTLTARVKES